MYKKILLSAVAALVLFASVGCDLIKTTTATTTPTTTETSTSTTSSTTTESTTSETTTTAATTTTETTTTGTTTTGTEATMTALIDTIPEECSAIDVVDGWVPVWCDEFEAETPGTIIDTTKWSYQTGGGGFGNQELQYYTGADHDNIAIVDGSLVITARKETYASNNYTSSKIWTQTTANWKYGKFEMRAKLPSGRGTWPAFWMMPSTSKYGGWPDSGEIDIMEHVGYNMNTVLGTLHTDRFNGSNGRGGSTTSLITSGAITAINVADVFHTYGMIWTEEKIEWYFDGMLFGYVEFDPTEYTPYTYDTINQVYVFYNENVDWPFNQQFYLILNLAIGGTWGGAQGVDDSIFPTSLTVDYVRVFQQDKLYGDTDNPSMISRVRVIKQADRNVFLVWNPATDDKGIKQYYVYVNGVLHKKTTVSGVLISNLKLNDDNFISIIAEDYAGNWSDPFETIITTT
ncbi:MAG: glycoside hydrolase family 16 protein [bacterium]